MALPWIVRSVLKLVNKDETAGVVGRLLEYYLIPITIYALL